MSEFDILCELYGPYGDEAQSFIMKLFNYRCPKCGGKADTVHEIRPRSRGKSAATLSNRTAICHSCHTEVHRLGTSDERIAEWQEIRDNFLGRL